MPPPEKQEGFEQRSTTWLFLPMIAMTGVVVLTGFGAEPVFVLANQAAKQLVDPAEYVQAVLGARP
jgi:multicomponent Na+:H+ antiporter subunit D